MIELVGQVKHIKLTGRLMIDPAAKTEPSLQDKTGIPSNVDQVIEVDPGFDGMSSFTILGDENFIAKNIKNGVTIWGIEGLSAASPFAVKAVGVRPVIYMGTARSNGLVCGSLFETSALGVLYEEA